MMRIAVIHDWLVTYGGAERVLEQMLLELKELGEVQVFTLIDTLPSDGRAFLLGCPVHTSRLQHLPFARRRYRSYLPIMPLLMEQFDLAGFDLVVSSSHAVAKGVTTGPDTLHLCLCYSPMRYAWDLQFQYLRETGNMRGLRSAVIRLVLHYMRFVDLRTAAGVDHFAAISHFIARRIRKAYRRESVVIYPPVDLEAFQPGDARGSHFLTAGRLVPYKRVDLMIDAFRQRPDLRLDIIGDGPDRRRLERNLPDNVRLLGAVPHAVLRTRLQEARAFVFAAEEDFGIAPIEAQACGVPVIALHRGAARETIRGLDDAQPSGVFFAEQSVEDLLGAIVEFERREADLTAANCRANADRFSTPRFRQAFRAFVRGNWQAWLEDRA